MILVLKCHNHSPLIVDCPAIFVSRMVLLAMGKHFVQAPGTDPEINQEGGEL